MANTIGWGQAHINNTIGYGQGAANSADIGWGIVQKAENSPGGETVLYGLTNEIIQSYFTTRVTADGGTVEGLTCITII